MPIVLIPIDWLTLNTREWSYLFCDMDVIQSATATYEMCQSQPALVLHMATQKLV